MGGYGALRLALTHPERYAAAASLSGALDVVALAGTPERAELFDRIFGGEPPGPDDDLFALLAAARRRRPAAAARLAAAPRTCCTPLSRRFADEAAAAGAT